MLDTLWIVLTTLPDREAAINLGRSLVQLKLVACAQILPAMTSIYEWEGKICEETEYLLLLKTPKSKYAELEKELRSLHPYAEPEILGLEAAAVSATYLQWAIETSHCAP
jgi:periplasmic divalent cation tolerance protein